MIRIPLKYIHAYADRQGKPRYYFRKAGQKAVTLPDNPRSPEFMAAYQAALNGEATAPKTIRGRVAREGSIDALVIAFYASPQFDGLRQSSKRIYRGILERFRVDHGAKRVAKMTRKNVKKLIAERSKTPSAANNFRSVLRNLMAFAADNDYRDDNPVSDTKRLKVGKDGFHAWTDGEIAAFEKRWPIGTRARLAMALQLYTGQRRSDVVNMTWRDIEGGKIRVKQVKTETELRIKIHPKLKAILDATPKKHISILTTKGGSAMLAASYGIWFRDCASKAGLPPECASHGLRKAAARRLAEAGCSANQIASVTGHISLKEVERYTKAADRERMGEQAIDALANAEQNLAESNGV